jgi:ABC-2 type transport system permease protein
MTSTATTNPVAAAASSSASAALALARTEVRLVLRNRTVAVSSIAVPLGLGLFWAFTFSGDGSPASHAIVLSLQLAVVLGMGVYATAAHTLVARRHAKVLKRMRTSSLSDRGLLAATVAPSVVIGLLQLAVFAVLDAATGVPLPSDPLPLVLAVLGGLALVVTAAIATATVTASPERAQITTLPLVFVLLGAAVVLSVLPLEGWWVALLAVPGAPVGHLTQLAMTGGTWAAGVGGLPAVVPSLVGLVVWPVVFGMLAGRWFRWDPRH